jgi:hypothetical protein
MRKPMYLSSLVLLSSLIANAQLICIPNTQVSYPLFALRAGLSPSFLVRFDVIAFTPLNIQIVGLDSLSRKLIEPFSESVLDNLHRFVFLKDSLGASLTFRYQWRPRNQLSTRYAELVSPSEIRIVSPPLHVEGRSRGNRIRAVDEVSDSSIEYSYLKYKGGLASPSDIFAEKFFDGRPDSIVILRNNYPSLTTDIDSVARNLSKERFLYIAPAATHFFIRFKVLRYIPECECVQTY